MGWTMIHIESRVGNKEIVRLLIDYNANINIKDTYGKLPIDYALQNGHNDVVELLKIGKTYKTKSANKIKKIKY